MRVGWPLHRCLCFHGDEAFSFPSKRHQKIFLIVISLFSITVIIALNIKTTRLVMNPNVLDQEDAFVRHAAELATDTAPGRHHNPPSPSISPETIIRTTIQTANNSSNRSSIAHSGQLNITNAQPTQHRALQWLSTPKPSQHTSTLDDQKRLIDLNLHLNMSTKNRRLKLLWFNPPGWMADWDRHVDMDQCSYSNCELTKDRKLFHDSSAVIFSITDAGMGRKPPITPAQRNPNQPWIFYSLESPSVLPDVHPKWNNPNWHNVFNWSWTYRSDSEIYHPYGVFKTKDTLTLKNYTQIYRRKKRSVAWLVSHCLTVSYREDYVKLLQKYIDVDIYGECGKGATAADIENAISRDYKFYLGFENALCKDYVTEKLFHYYKMDLITVVRGFVRYNRFVPNGTFVDTADFPNIKALAEFLHKLGANEQEYVEYLKRKDKYEVYERRVMYRNALCSICEKVNNLEQNKRVYADVYKWLGYCYMQKDILEN